MKKHSIVVTGSDGFIGSRTLLRLLQSMPAADLLAVDHPRNGQPTRNASLIQAVEFVDHNSFADDLENRKRIADIIIHLGACSDTTETRWDFLFQNNVVYSQRLWSWCAANGSRLIYASSAATYGDGGNGFDDEADINRLQPLNLYGRSKQEFDLWVQQQAAAPAKPAQCVGLKFFNVFGPGEEHKGRMASMVFHARNQIRERGSVRLFKSHHPDYTDGGQLRDFIAEADVIRMIEQLIARPDISGLFNVGTGAARSFADLARAVFAALDLKDNIEYFPMPDDLQGKYQYFTQATMKKLARTGIDVACPPLERAVAACIGGYA